MKAALAAAAILAITVAAGTAFAQAGLVNITSGIVATQAVQQASQATSDAAKDSGKNAEEAKAEKKN